MRDLRGRQHHLRLRLFQRRRGGVDLLPRRRLFREAALAVVIGLRLDEIGVGVGELRLRLLQLGGKILAGDLRAKLLPGELMFRRLQRAFGLLAVDLVLPRIDVNQRLALFDELIVGDVERDDGRRRRAAR